MKIVIEGTPEEIADALRRLAPPEDIKPIFAPKRAPEIDPFVIPFIPYDPPQTVPYPYSPATDRLFWGTRITSDGTQFTYTM
jgi:hypothetical protein